MYAWPCGQRPLHPCNAWTEHVGFPPTRQALLVSLTRSAVRCSASRMRDELHPINTKNRLLGGLRRLMRTFLPMDDSAEFAWLISLCGEFPKDTPGM